MECSALPCAHPLVRRALQAMIVGSLLLSCSQSTAAEFAAIKKIVEQRCTSCHNTSKKKGGIDLSRFHSPADVQKDLRLWRDAGEAVRHGDMPPAKAPALAPEEKKQLLQWIGALRYTGRKDPGSVTIRRLNRHEYNNTMRDLLAMDRQPAKDFPSDEVGYGFDNIGDVLSMPPLLMEKYLTAAQELLDEAIVYEQLKMKIPASDLHLSHQGKDLKQTIVKKALVLDEMGEASVTLTAPIPGDYKLIAKIGAQQAGTEVATVQFFIGKRTIDAQPVKTTSTFGRTMRVTAKGIKTGEHRFGIRFVNPGTGTYRNKEAKRAIHIHYLEIQGPRSSRVPASHRRIMISKPGTRVEPREAAAKIIKAFADKAYRRPATQEQVDKLLKLYDQAAEIGLPFEDSVRLMLQAVLISPHFLYRIELDPPANKDGSVRKLDAYEMASRLSYFLWTSMPDATLFKLAANGSLTQTAVLEAQVERMIKDRKFQGFVESFCGQWLQLRQLGEVAPDADLYPDYNSHLEKSMRAEAYAFFTHIAREQRSSLEFLDADYTFADARLAKHYGLSGLKGSAMQLVNLSGDQRGGVLGMAGVLTVTSYPHRTSPVKRGKFVLEQIVGDPPPPPPPNVEDLADEKGRKQGLSMRQMLDHHRDNPSCSACHKAIDPIGFGLENYDAIGRWRRSDNGAKLDTSGTLPSGEGFVGPKQLRQVFAKHKREQFIRCLTEKLMVFALGRGIESYDEPSIEAIVSKAAKDDYRLSTMLSSIVTSYPFRHGRR